MKVFESLNCILCKRPFVPIAREPQSPRVLECGLAMCHECFEKEKMLKKDERKHQCIRADCFKNPNFAYFLIDVLSQDSLTLAPIGVGYFLSKPFKIPECPICQEEYSLEVDGKKPLRLYCNHTVCTECYLKRRKPNNDETTMANYKYLSTCPTCNGGTISSDDEWKDRRHDFLAELPEMSRQLEEMGSTKYRFCEGCKKMDTVDEMFYCNKCTFEVCGTCAFRCHRSHKVISLLQKEAYEMSEEIQSLSIQETETYNDLFTALHRELLDDIGVYKKKLLWKEKNLKQMANFGELQKKHKECKKLKEDFETSSEEYMPHLRKYGAKVKDLIQTLDKQPKSSL